MPSLKQLTAVFLRVGNTTFGGGDPTIAVLQREFERRGWLDAEQFVLAYGLARVTPGTNVTAFCAGAAWIMRGLAGAVMAVLALTVPSAVLVIWLTHMCEIGGSNRWARAAIAGTVAAAVGAMLAAALNLTRLQITKMNWLSTILIVAVAFVLVRMAGLSPIQVLGLAAIAGLIGGRS